MSAPAIWILVPLLAGGLIALFVPRRYASLVGGTLSTLLALVALMIPIDTALLLGAFSLKISAAVNILGRSFALNIADGILLAIIYGLAAFWFFGVNIPNGEKRFVSLGLVIIALLVASMAVEPFLYAALLLEMAVILAIPLLIPIYQQAGRGAARFLIYHTLAVPFILFSGWMLAGAEVTPGNLSATLPSGGMLGLGFAFLFGIFPFYNWIPMLLEEASPYAVGFILWALSIFTTIFALGFFDRYTWMRASPLLANAILLSGVIMVATGGIFAALQKHLGRMMGYAVIVETGLILIALGIHSADFVGIIFLLLIPRGFELVVWSLGISVIKRDTYSLRLGDVRGLARRYPAATGAMILAHLSMAGVPLLAGFPSRLVLWQDLARQSLLISFWVSLGMLGLLVSAIRALAVLVMAEQDTPWSFRESWLNLAMLSVGILGLFLLGIFPQILQPFTNHLPALFEHLGP